MANPIGWFLGLRRSSIGPHKRLAHSAQGVLGWGSYAEPPTLPSPHRLGLSLARSGNDNAAWPNLNWPRSTLLVPQYTYTWSYTKYVATLINVAILVFTKVSKASGLNQGRWHCLHFPSNKYLNTCQRDEKTEISCVFGNIFNYFLAPPSRTWPPCGSATTHLPPLWQQVPFWRGAYILNTFSCCSNFLNIAAIWTVFTLLESLKSQQLN